jgi:hypothetical protein
MQRKAFNIMNAKIRNILTGAACAVAGALVCAAPSIAYAADGQTTAVENVTAGPSPSPAHVWMAGHWDNEGGQWKWVAGHWDLPPTRSSVWVPGHWVQGGNSWVWVNGAWNVAEAPQSPSAPPQPPGASSDQAGPAVPMPSTPAPQVAGQYVQGGQVPAIYQGPTDTYYPPIDYSAAYPGYYWDGAAWGWGFYPGFALGFGWGPGFYGWGGRGGWGYGHGGGWHGARAVGHAGAAHFSGGHWR